MMQPYNPDVLPLSTIDWERHVILIGQANAALARYDGILLGMVNPQVLLSPLTTREAVYPRGLKELRPHWRRFCSTRRMSVTRKRLKPFPTQIRDIHEIINYRKAMGTAVEKMAGWPFGINTIRELHRILLAGVEGCYKDPGEIRRIQNYIAPPGTPIEKATFIPPSPETIMDFLSNWEDHLYFAEKDPLVQLAILKAQFELIHPFRDGDWDGWISFFLEALVLQSEENRQEKRGLFWSCTTG